MNQLATMDSTHWDVMQQQAAMLVKTGFLPEAIKTPEQAIAIMLKGQELGIPPMYALSNIVVIKGKPAASAELLLSLIYRDHGDSAANWLEATDKVATLQYKRRNWPAYKRFSFTIEDAARAGLSSGNTWKQYPGAMLRARCISAVARAAFPDSIGGMYTPEELGASLDGFIDPEDVTFEIRAAQGFVDGMDDHVIDAVADDDAVRQAQMRRLHAVGKGAGLSHEELRDEVGVESLTGATTEQLSTIADVLDAYQNALHESPEWANDIKAVTSMEELHHVRDLMKQAGVTGKDFPMLLRYYTARQNRLKIDTTKAKNAA